jgi:hypothetical protein
MAITLDGTTGITTPAETITTNLTFTGTGNRITGDFSNATYVNRVAFQSSTVNGVSSPFIIPNGTGISASIIMATTSDPTNCSYGQIAANGSTDVRIVSGQLGTGTYLPMTFYTGGSERARIDTSGNLLFNSGYGSAATAYGCRAWVNFNGTGTVAIRASGNVSSITDNGTGDYTVNFTTAMVDANYASLRNVQESGTVQVVRGESTSASQAGVYVTNTSNVTSDATNVYFAAFR